MTYVILPVFFLQSNFIIFHNKTTVKTTYKKRFFLSKTKDESFLQEKTMSFPTPTQTKEYN